MHQTPSQAYSAAQSALTPTSEPLQVDGSLDSLAEAVEFNLETVRALLRRLEPVTSDVFFITGMSGSVVVSATDGSMTSTTPSVKRVQLACRLDAQREAIALLTREVQATIRALQI